LASFDSWGGVIPNDFALSSTRWTAEYFQITPPPDVTTMNIARVKLMMRTGNPDPTATVSAGIHRSVAPGDPTPEPTPIGTPAVIVTSTLQSSATWVDFMFSDVVIDLSETEYVIVVKGTTLGTASVQQYYWKSAPPDATILLMTTDSGSSWEPRASAYDDNDMPFHIYGTYDTETTQEITTSRYFLESVRIALRIGPDQPTTAETAVQILNAPEVTGP
jgi:hypothetical protein